MTTARKPGFVAETPRQEGAWGRVGRTPADTLSNGEIDASDPNNPPVDAPNSTNDQGRPPRQNSARNPKSTERFSDKLRDKR